jgi:hypothetical protein
MLQSLSNGLGNLVVSIVMFLAGPTIIMLLLKRFLPVLGDELWRLYSQALVWLIRAPFRLIRILVDELFKARRRP